MTDVYEDLRPLMFSIAYRMLGSASEAEDIVQDAFLRFHQAAKEQEIENPKAYLAQITTRLSIDHLRSARVRRESYVGPWLPEPVLTEQVPDASQHAEMADSMSMAFLVLLESLSPVERAVFLLREVFDYPYGEIAETIGKSEDNTRQLAVRARRHVDERRPRFEADRKARDELAGRFFAAAQEGDTDGLLQLLAKDVVLYGDGGGKGPAITKPMYGAEKVARFMSTLMRRGKELEITIEPAEVNGEAGAITRDREGRVASVLSMQIADGQIISLRSVVNPDKLGHLGEVADLGALLKGGRVTS
ncbi:MAG TPA: RNA polymerase sigma-70 factor [Thermoleophilaceae bacterium]|nr:RNA polymerase sigma-70 factor [Thermoleophilaceae bacterium]